MIKKNPGECNMTTKKEKYLQWKHQLLNDCGQCLGFRAKGVSLENNTAGGSCNPGISCHLSCPALGTAKPVQEIAVVSNDRLQAKGSGKSYIVQSCMRCGGNEDDAVLLPCRFRGESRWVCTKCLPDLIHG